MQYRTLYVCFNLIKQIFVKTRFRYPITYVMENKTSTGSRVKKTLLNARVNLIFYFLTPALSFFSRKIFLDCLGADFVGLTGTLQNLLGFLNLAELGIGSAILQVLT